MQETQRTAPLPRILAALTALGLGVVAVLTIRHYFTVQFPGSLADAAACRADTFFDCTDSATTWIAAPYGVPIGVIGLVVSGTLLMAALFPSPPFESFTRRLSLVNALLAATLSVYSIVVLRSLCPLCSLYTLLAVLHVSIGGLLPSTAVLQDSGRSLSFALRYLAVILAVTLFAGWSVTMYRDAREAARAGGEAAAVARSFLVLEQLPQPSLLSPYWIVRSTDRFEDAPIRIIEYGDFLCTDCRFFAEQVHRLEQDFPGQLNVAWQFFPLEATCNDVVDKDKHPGACDLAYIAAFRPAQFRAIHDEIFAAGDAARDRQWQQDLARRYNAQAALGDSATHALVGKLIDTGAEYEKTAAQYAHGIRSTPTLLVNGRMIIGTLPYEQLRAIVLALLEEQGAKRRFIENWESEKGRTD
jgi:protein-disulfide isomerase